MNPEVVEDGPDEGSAATFAVSQEVRVSKALGRRFPELPALATLVECSVCYGALREPSGTPCGHTFCSLCVRDYLTYRQQCPSCLKELHERELVPNKALKAVAEHFLTLVPKLEKALPPPEVKSFLPPPPSPTPTKKSVSTPKSQAVAPTPEFRRTASFTTPSKPSPFKEEVKCVPCPVCSVSIPEKNINRHLDLCLKLKDQPAVSSPTPSRSQVKLKPLNKVVYHLLKDGQLKKHLKDLGLSVRGDRKALEWRHKRYTVLWNSQCQAEHPLSKMEVRMEVEKEERGLGQQKTLPPKVLEYDRNTDPTVIARKQAEYVSKNNNQFSNLINQIKNRKAKERKDDDPIPSTSKCDPLPFVKKPASPKMLTPEDQPVQPLSSDLSPDLLKEVDYTRLINKHLSPDSSPAKEKYNGDHDDVFQSSKATRKGIKKCSTKKNVDHRKAKGKEPKMKADDPIPSSSKCDSLPSLKKPASPEMLTPEDQPARPLSSDPSQDLLQEVDYTCLIKEHLNPDPSLAKDQNNRDHDDVFQSPKSLRVGIKKCSTKKAMEEDFVETMDIFAEDDPVPNSPAPKTPGPRARGECPICHQRVLLSQMNSHVDLCILKKEEKPKRTRRKAAKAKPEMVEVVPDIHAVDDDFEPKSKRLKCTRGNNSRLGSQDEIENIRPTQ